MTFVVSAKMNAVVSAAKAAINNAKENPALATSFAIQAVARTATQLYGCDKEGVLELARDASVYVCPQKVQGNDSKNWLFFENVVKEFYQENNVLCVSRIVVDMYRQITEKVQFGVER